MQCSTDSTVRFVFKSVSFLYHIHCHRNVTANNKTAPRYYRGACPHPRKHRGVPRSMHPYYRGNTATAVLPTSPSPCSSLQWTTAVNNYGPVAYLGGEGRWCDCPFWSKPEFFGQFLYCYVSFVSQMNCKIQVPKILVTVRVFCLFQRIRGFSKTMRYINRHYLSIYLSIYLS